MATLSFPTNVAQGWSYIENRAHAKNDHEVNAHFGEFLDKFFAVHSDLVKEDPGATNPTTRQMHISGESHAGHYIPSMSKFLLEQNINRKREKRGLIIDLKVIFHSLYSQMHRRQDACSL
jgi:carboxypeptidase C (cathepsin A)